MSEIAVMPIRRPRYDNTFVSDFRRWYVANEPRLVEYYEELGQYASEPTDDFFDFAVTQHDMEANKECTDG